MVQNIVRTEVESIGETKIVNIAIGNHRYVDGIVEVLFTLMTYLSSRYDTKISFDVIPNAINILIDEFSLPGSVDFLAKIKSEHPCTKFVIVATELVTEVKFLGRRLALTFNYFSDWEDRWYGLGMLAHRLNPRRMAPYMQRRYVGFVKALELADLVISIHPGISKTLRLLPTRTNQANSTPLMLYPEIDTYRVVHNPRLWQLPTGFVLTGTLTPFRQKVARKLIKTASNAGIEGAVYQYLPIRKNEGFSIEDGQVKFEWRSKTEVKHRGDESRWARDRLYNLNPPRGANWPYSSPMRILRAVLFGYVPVVTQKFGDHDLESVAMFWDSTAASLNKLWLDATIGRNSLIERYIKAIGDYNKIARQKNGALDKAFQALWESPQRSQVTPT